MNACCREAVAKWVAFERELDVLAKRLSVSQMQTVEFETRREADAFYAEHFPGLVPLRWERKRKTPIGPRGWCARDATALHLVTCVVYD